MTSDLFKSEVDRIDSGLPDHPDLGAYMRSGRALRRRRRATVALGAGALVAAVAAPAVLWGGGGPTTDPATDAASASTSESPTPTPSPTVTPSVDPSAYDDQAQRMTAAVRAVFPQAERTSDDFFDHYVALDDGTVDIALNDPPDWGSVFRWNQVFDLGDLQFFSVSSSWEASERTPMAWCSAGSFAIEKDCQVTELDGGYQLVLHDGVRMEGEAEGDWSRFAQLVSPPTAGGHVQLVEVWAQEEDMTWPQAQAVLPTLEDLAAVVEDERMRLPEPVTLPETP